MTITNNFQKLDYGAAGNLIHYGQPTPPQYDLGKMHVPVALFTGLDFLTFFSSQQITSSPS